MKEIKGRCCCGGVEYSIPDSFAYAAYCHCSQCRRATGSSFTVFGGIPTSDIKMLKGEALLSSSKDNNDHDTIGCFCMKCGTSIFDHKQDWGLTHIGYGHLDEAPSMLPQVHIYTGSKAAWTSISDGLPQYEEGLEE